jgi:hypothetical protein
MSMFDEEPDGDPHGECAAEIARLNAIIAALGEQEPVAEVIAWPQFMKDEPGVGIQMLNDRKSYVIGQKLYAHPVPPADTADYTMLQEALNAVGKELDDVEYKGSYADGVVLLKRKLSALQERYDAAQNSRAPTIYDHRIKVEEIAERHSSHLYHVLKRLTAAVKERQGLSESIDSTVLVDAMQILATIDNEVAALANDQQKGGGE